MSRRKQSNPKPLKVPTECPSISESNNDTKLTQEKSTDDEELKELDTKDSVAVNNHHDNTYSDSESNSDEPSAKRIKQERSESPPLPNSSSHQTQNGDSIVDNTKIKSSPLRNHMMSSSPNSMMEGLLSHLQLPSDVLHLKRIEVSMDNNPTYGWVVCSGIPLPKGSSLGPFQGEIISTDKVQMGDLILQFTSGGGKQAFVNVSNQSGAWLTLLRQSRDSSCCNTLVHLDGGRLWCQVESDLDIGSELIASFTFHVEGEEDRHNHSPESAAAGAEESVNNHNNNNTTTAKVTQPVITQTSSKPTSASGHAALIYGCPFCGVRFSSPRTLQGHISFYCSRKPSASEQDEESQSDGVSNPVKDEPVTDEDSESQEPKSLKRSAEDTNSPLESPEAKFQRPEQVSYPCTLCSYTTDKLTSLNRHRRIHNRCSQSSSSPKAVPIAASSADTYCQECNIQFSSMNTFKAHKEFYCSQRSQLTKTLDKKSDRNSDDSSQASSSPKLLSPEKSRLFSPSNHHIMSPQSFKSVFSNGLLARDQSILYTPVVGADGKPSLMPSVLLPPILSVPPIPESLTTSRVKPAHQQEQKRSDSPKKRVSEDEPLDLSTSKSTSSTSKPDYIFENKRIKSEISSPTASDRSTKSTSPKTTNSSSINPGLLANPFLAGMIPNFFPFSLNASNSATGLPVPGVSKCTDCNIVFYKHENFVIHKQHYCSGKKIMKSPTPVPEINLEAKSPERFNTKPSTSFETETSRQTEEIQTHNDVAYRFFCIPCKIKFSSASTLTAHKEFYCPHGKDSEDTSVSQTSPTTPEENTDQSDSLQDEVELRCNLCENRFPSLRLLKIHVCSAEKSKLAFLRCAHCDYVTQTESRMTDHMKVHAPTRSFRCTICGYRGNTIRGMRMHGKTHIDNGEEFNDDNMLEYREPPLVPIESNGHSVPSPLDMESELLRIKNEPYKRRRSKKSFEKSENMGLQVQQCAICGDTFANSNYLSIHMKTHSAASSTMVSTHPKFPCDQCNYVAMSIKDLVIHESKHEVTNDSGQENTDPNSTPSPSPSPKEMTIKKELIDNDYETVSRSRTPTPPDDVKPVISKIHKSTVRRSSDSPRREIPVNSPEPCPTSSSGNIRPYLIIPNTSSLSANLHLSPQLPPIPQEAKYCHSCDISFTYLSSFLAHKKYYCTSHTAEKLSPTAIA